MAWTITMPKKFRRSENGAAAIEFALVALPLIVLLGAIIEISLMLVAQFELQHATERAARLIRTGGATNMTESDFRAVVCSRVVLVPSCATSINVDVRNATNFATLATNAPAPRFVGPEDDDDNYTPIFQPGASAKPGRLVVTYDWTFVFPFLRVFSNLPLMPNKRRLYGLAAFMNEPF